MRGESVDWVSGHVETSYGAAVYAILRDVESLFTLCCSAVESLFKVVVDFLIGRLAMLIRCDSASFINTKSTSFPPTV
jgi:hypothetical protein